MAYLYRTQVPYFSLNPYVTKTKTDELCKRLSLTKAELAAHCSKKRSKCMKSLKRNTAVVFLGFNMTELSKVKHNLTVPEEQPVDTAEQPLTDSAEQLRSDSTEQPLTDSAKQPQADSTDQMENSEDGPEPMDESGNEKVTDGEQVEQME